MVWRGFGLGGIPDVSTPRRHRERLGLSQTPRRRLIVLTKKEPTNDSNSEPYSEQVCHSVANVHAGHRRHPAKSGKARHRGTKGISWMAPARGACDSRNLGVLFLRFSPNEKMAKWPPFWESLIRHPPADCGSSWSETSSRAVGRGAGGETAGLGLGQSRSGPTGPAPVLRIRSFHASVLWFCY